MVCAPVRSIIPSLKLGDFLSVQAQKPCSVPHLNMPSFLPNGNVTFAFELFHPCMEFYFPEHESFRCLDFSFTASKVVVIERLSWSDLINV